MHLLSNKSWILHFYLCIKYVDQLGEPLELEHGIRIPWFKVFPKCFLSVLLHHNEPTRFISFSSSEVHYLIYIKFLLTCGLSAVVQSVWKCAFSTTIVLLGCFLKCLHNWKWCMSWANGLSPDYRALGAFTALQQFMMTSSNRNIFRVTGHLCGGFSGPRWIPRTKASDAELWCFLWSASE